MVQDRLHDEFSSGLDRAEAELKVQLQEAVRRTRRFGKTFVGLLVMAAFIIGFSFYYFVWRYAVIDQVKITQDSANPSTVGFRFAVVSEGFIEYGHGNSRSGEPVGKGDERNFSYRRPVRESETRFTVFIRCRKAIFPYWYSETFWAKGS